MLRNQQVVENLGIFYILKCVQTVAKKHIQLAQEFTWILDLNIKVLRFPTCLWILMILLFTISMLIVEHTIVP